MFLLSHIGEREKNKNPSGYYRKDLAGFGQNEWLQFILAVFMKVLFIFYQTR